MCVFFSGGGLKHPPPSQLLLGISNWNFAQTFVEGLALLGLNTRSSKTKLQPVKGRNPHLYNLIFKTFQNINGKKFKKRFGSKTFNKKIVKFTIYRNLIGAKNFTLSIQCSRLTCQQIFELRGFLNIIKTFWINLQNWKEWRSVN